MEESWPINRNLIDLDRDEVKLAITKPGGGGGG